jgi:hypothetical protein
MNATLLMLCLLFESASLLFIGLGVPLLRSRSPANGYESPSMMRDAAAWRAVGTATGLDLIAIGATLAPLAFVLWLTSTRPAVFAMTCSGWLLCGATGILLHAMVLMARRPG